MAEAAEALSGVQRAAILLMSMGEQGAAEVLKHMGARDVQQVGAAMATITKVSKVQAMEVVERFVDEIDGQTSLGVGADDYVRKVLVDALGEEKAGGVIDRILLGKNTKGIEALKWMEPRAVAELIRNEHPQIIAIVMSYLDADQAADTLAAMPERIRGDILMRIATLDGIQPNALAELDEVLESQFAGKNNIKSSSVGGIKTAANILNLMDSSSEAQIIELINSADQQLGQSIQDQMFVFDNLGDLDDRAIQALMRDVPGELLGVALKGADPGVKEKIMRNMSKRAAEILNEDMAAKGPVKVSDVEAAQREILAVVRRLADAGTISIGSSGEDYV